MKTGTLLTLLLALLFGGTAFGQVVRNPSDAVYADLQGLLPFEEEEPEPPLPPDLPPGARAIAMRLLAREFTLHASVFRVDPGALPYAGLTAERLRRLIDDGRAELLNTARVTGKAADRPLEYSIGRCHAALRFHMESAQDAVASYPRIEALQHGLWLSARFGIVPGRGVRVRYRVLFAGPPEIDRRETIAGKLDFSSVPALFAESGVVLWVGETTFVVSTEWTRTTVVALTLLGPDGSVDPVTDLGDGWAMAVGGHLQPPTVRRLPIPGGFDPTYAFSWRVREPEPRSAVWRRVLADAHISPFPWQEGPCGLWFGRPDEPDRARLRALLRQTAESRAKRGSVTVTRPAWRKLVLPISTGENYRVFRGKLQTLWGGYSVQSGCSSASGAEAMTRFTFAGLAAKGRAGLHGNDELTLVGREELSREWYETSLRRTLPTFKGYARDRVRFPLIRDRVFAYDGPLPAEGNLVGGASVRVDCPRVSAGPVSDPIVVRGIAAALLPGRTTTLLDIERRQAVTMWHSDGWCGMRIRYPVTGAQASWPAADVEDFAVPWGVIWQGFFTVLEPKAAGRLSVRGETRGPAENLGRFDPLDGEVDLIRQPRLAFQTTVDLGGGGPIAWCPGLSFDIRRLGHAYGFKTGREVICGTSSGETGFVCTAEGRLQAGGTMILPQGFHAYTSHVGGEVTTDFREVQDGTSIEIADGSIEYHHTTRLNLIPRKADTEDDPSRSGSGLRTLNLSQREVRRTLPLNPDGTLDAPAPGGVRLTIRGVK